MSLARTHATTRDDARIAYVALDAAAVVRLQRVMELDLAQETLERKRVSTLVRCALQRLEAELRAGTDTVAGRDGRFPKLTPTASRALTYYVRLFTLECLQRSILEAEIEAGVGDRAEESLVNLATTETPEDVGSRHVSAVESSRVVRVQPEHVLRVIPQLLLDF